MKINKGTLILWSDSIELALKGNLSLILLKEENIELAFEDKYDTEVETFIEPKYINSYGDKDEQ